MAMLASVGPVTGGMTSGSCPSGATLPRGLPPSKAACPSRAGGLPAVDAGLRPNRHELPTTGRGIMSLHSAASDQESATIRRSLGIDTRLAPPGLADPSRKVRLTVNLPTDLVEQMRDAVHATPGVTLAWLVARALRTSLAELHANNHGPFPRRAKPLRAGRPRLAGQFMQVHVPDLAIHVSHAGNSS